MTVQAGFLSLDNSAISSDSGTTANDPSDEIGNGGNVTVAITGPIALTDAGVINASSYTAGHGGSVNVSAGSMTLDGSEQIGTVTGIEASTYGYGAAGTVTTTVGGELDIVGDANIGSDTFSRGQAGAVDVQAGTLSINGSATSVFLRVSHRRPTRGRPVTRGRST